MMINKLRQKASYITTHLSLALVMTLLFFVFINSTSNTQLKAEVVIDKVDGMIDWNRASNYREAEQNLQIAKGIYAERKRRKQLQNANVSKKEIEEIIKKERADGLYSGQSNNNSKTSKDEKQTKNDNDKKTENNDNKDDDDADQDNSYSINGVDFDEEKEEKKQTKSLSVKNKKKKKNYYNSRKKKNKIKEIEEENNDDRQDNNDSNDYNDDGDDVRDADENNENYTQSYAENTGKYAKDNDNNSYTRERRNTIKNTTSRFVKKQQEEEKKQQNINVLNIVPPIPVINSKNSNNAIYRSNNDNFEISRMLRKTDENANNRENFMLFAKEISRIVNKWQIGTNNNGANMQQYVAVKKNVNDVNMQNNLNGANTNTNDDGLIAKKTKSNDSSLNIAQRLGNMYAVAPIDKKDVNNNSGKAKTDDNKTNIKTNNKTNKNDVKIKSNTKKEENNKKSVKKNKNNNKSLNNININNINANDDYLIEDDMIEYKDLIQRENENNKDNLVSNDNSLTTKQIRAKNLNAPLPVQRHSNDKRTQYQPQNISQVSYDKNNKHLNPAVFESHIVSQVFDNLGDKNAIQTVRALINRFGKIDFTDEDGNTLLMHAVARKNQSLIAMLLSEGADPNRMNKDGFAPVHYASSYGDNVAMYSLMMNGANANLQDKNGNTALMYAAKMCNADTVKLMLSLGGDPLIVNPITKMTALDFAEENTDSAIVGLLKTKKINLLRSKNPINLTFK